MSSYSRIRPSALAVFQKISSARISSSSSTFRSQPLQLQRRLAQQQQQQERQLCASISTSVISFFLEQHDEIPHQPRTNSTRGSSNKYEQRPWSANGDEEIAPSAIPQDDHNRHLVVQIMGGDWDGDDDGG